MTMVVSYTSEEMKAFREIALKAAIDDIDNKRDYHPDYDKWPGDIQKLYERSRHSYMETKLKNKK